MIDNQLGCRDLTTACELRLREARYALLAKEAKIRQGERTDLNEGNIVQKSEQGRVAHQIARESGTSHDTVCKYNYVSKNIAEEVLNQPFTSFS